jgi:hypothetical protein
MNDDPAEGGALSADPHPRLGTAALAAVVTGVVLLAAAAFVFSYSGIHHIALAAGVAPKLARAYPLIFDAMLVIALAAALALRGGGWWTRAFVWLCLLVLLAAVAAADAVHAMGISLPRKQSAAAVAIIPWALVLLAFSLLLAMLRQVRRARSARAARPAGEALAGPRSAAPPLPDRPAPANAAQAGAAAARAEGAGQQPGQHAVPPATAPQPAVSPRPFDRLRSTPIAPEKDARDDEEDHQAGGGQPGGHDPYGPGAAGSPGGATEQDQPGPGGEIPLPRRPRPDTGDGPAQQ